MLQCRREEASIQTGGIKEDFHKEGTYELRKKGEEASSGKEDQMQRKGRGRRNEGGRVNRGQIMGGPVYDAKKSGLS